MLVTMPPQSSTKREGDSSFAAEILCGMILTVIISFPHT